MYEALGFNQNPFFTEALSPSKEGANKFVGRHEDIRAFLTQIAGREGCVHLVTGNRGVGKTSFVNVLQYLTSLADPREALGSGIKHFPKRLVINFQKLQINTDDTAQTLMLKVTSSLISSMVNLYEEKDKRLPKKISIHHKKLNELITSQTSRGYNLSAYGFGGGVGGKSVGYEHGSNSSINQLSKIVKEVLAVGLKDFNKNGVYVIIDNLDIVERNKLVKILNELRDELFSIKSLWIIFLGAIGTYHSIKQHRDGNRIADNLRGTETVLESLKEDEAWEILKVRARTFSINQKKPSKLPLSEELIRNIYQNCDGEIRFLFKVCDQIVRKVLTNYPSLTFINDEVASVAIKPIIEEETGIKHLKKRELKLLRELIKNPLRPKDYKKISFGRASEFTNTARKLMDMRLVRKREEGKAAIYGPTGPTLFAHKLGLF